MAAFAFVKISGGYRDFGTNLSLGDTQYRYDMSGFDSSGGGRVYWASVGSINLTPASTNPTLVGSLVYPHLVGMRVL